MRWTGASVCGELLPLGVGAILLFSATAAQSLSESPASSRVGPKVTAPLVDQAAALKLSQEAIGKVLGDYALKSSDGKIVRLSSLQGKPLLVSFIYTGCFQVCPTTTRTLKRAVEAAQRALGPDSFNVVSIGFNLPFDTPDALRTYAHQQGIYFPNWQFLSPDQATLEAMTRILGFSYEANVAGFDHITQITVLDQKGRVYRQVYGDTFPLPQLVDALKELITGQRNEPQSLASLIERVRVLCTVYDPATGQYRYKYSILLEIAGGLFSLSAVGVFLLRELRKTRMAPKSG